MTKRILTEILLVILAISLVMPTIYVPVTAEEVPKGPWVDEVIFSSVTDDAQAINMLEAGDAHLYYYGLTDPELFKKVKASPNLWYALSYGSYNELTFNPVGPEFPATGKLNPFSDAKIREAMNYLVDREYIANEICGGLAVPRYVAITPSFPDYARLIDVCKKIELQYSYNFDKAKAIVTEEMKKLGAKLVNGKWQYKGEPVTIIILIRVEDERKEIGNYFANQLERLGFTVKREYKTSKEAAPLWLFGDPSEGKWHVYTGGWVTTAISRDESDNFDFFYTPRGLPLPLWQAYKPSKEFDEVSKKLATKDYATWEERNRLMARALELSMKDSVRIWLTNMVTAWVARKEVTQACDLAGGFYGARLWPYTLRFKDGVGGTVKIVTQASIPIEPWNPLGGSDWVYDTMIYRATFDPVLMPDPYTGLFWPLKVAKAEVYVKEGIPVTKTLDWLTLHFTGEIKVPTDAWYGWDAKKQEIITAPKGTTAKAKVIVYFRDDLFDTKWHDGSKVSLADFIYNYIITFDRASNVSAVYDEAYVPSFEAFRKYFKGFRIISENPLICEFYTDNVYPDAEWIVSDVAGWFYPAASYGPAPWHLITIGMLAEEKGKAAFTADKAKTLGVDRLNYITGGTLKVLEEMLNYAIENKYIPYKKVLGKYITEDEALARYKALKSWYESKGHFWIGDGPFYLESVDPTAHIIVIKANRNYPDKADKWAIFGKPKIPEIKVEGPATVISGLGSRFIVKVTYQGEPYKISDVESVKYLVIDATGKVKTVRMAEPIGDGLWAVNLEAADTSALAAGSAKLLVAVSSKLVSIPGVKETSFTTLSLEDYIGGKLSGIRAQLETKASSLEKSINSLQSQISSLQASISRMNMLAMASLGVAIIAIVIALVAILKKK
ncbi:ABC transporter substrate-binding protein [Candidatus Bathyarchaeota archaeon]|nr:ABC transporter substrate-binding protein [Candidatus Bathyarchaeota archaeon]